MGEHDLRPLGWEEDEPPQLVEGVQGKDGVLKVVEAFTGCLGVVLEAVHEAEEDSEDIAVKAAELATNRGPLWNSMTELLSSLEDTNVGLIVVPVKIWRQDELVLAAGPWVDPVGLPGLALGERHCAGSLLDGVPDNWELLSRGLHELVNWTLCRGSHD